MAAITSCPNCHQPVSLVSHYCPSCGKKISFRLLSTSASGEVFLYLKTILFPPLGFVWGIHYLRQSDSKSIKMGFIAILITFIESIIIILYIIHITDLASHQLISQLKSTGF